MAKALGKKAKGSWTGKEKELLLAALEARFAANMHRHKGMDWGKVRARLESSGDKLWSLNEMERTGGEPDVVAFDKRTGAYVFYDCAEESPKGRRSLCYDQQALDARKEHKPADSAVNMAASMGVELLDEEQYYELQTLGSFDCKTSSWILTPNDVRSLGGGLYGDRRYGRVFTGHNGADSYYAARGFRASLRV